MDQTHDNVSTNAETGMEIERPEDKLDQALVSTV